MYCRNYTGIVKRFVRLCLYLGKSTIGVTDICCRTGVHV